MTVGISPAGAQESSSATHIINPWQSQSKIEEMQLDRWYSTVKWNIAAENNRLALQHFYAVVSQPKPKPKPKEIQYKPRTNPKPQISTGTGRCGGDLPPCSVMMCESGGSLTAHNDSSGADGKWQIIPPTWNNYEGYSSPSSAPEAIQDERARQIYAGGAGRSAWSC